MKSLHIPKIAQEQIDAYKSLNLGGKKITCPYYMNVRGNKDLRAMVGKGLPEEIELEAQIWEKVKGVSFEDMSKKEIKEFLIERSIGIDCSGFVVHVLNTWYVAENNSSIWMSFTLPHKNILRKLAYRLKPVEKLGADIITNTENATEIAINDVLPGDVVRLKWKKKNSHHILLITQVDKHEDGTVAKLTYTHSIPVYGEESGVKTGEIEITNINKPLEEQNWLEKDKSGVAHTFEGYMIQKEDNGLRRINAMAQIIENQV